jgi:signal transduction histidine kinase
MAGANLELRTALAVSAVALLPALVIIAVVDHAPAVPILFDLMTTSLFFLIAHAGARARRELARSELMVAELADLHEVAAATAALAERGRIAREMHDVLAHSLSGLAIQLEAASLIARREDVSAPLQGALARSRRLAHDGLDEARRAIDALRGEHVPGPDALPRLVEDFDRAADIEVTLRVDGERRAPDAEEALTVYRVTQEALTNIARHSRAERASVELCYGADATRLVIADHGGDGSRVQLGDVGAGYGISAMRERAALLDGTVTADPTEDGFRVELVLPAEPR